jgi:type IV pilus assembly protein PilM
VDERDHNEIPVPGEPEEGEYGWLKPQAEPADEATRAWTGSGAEPAEPVEASEQAWAAPEVVPAATPHRPSWAPEVFQLSTGAPAPEAPAEPATVASEAPAPAPELPVEAPAAGPPPVEISPLPQPETAPVPAEAPVVIDQPPAEAPKSEGGSFLKKDISFRRKPKPPASEAPKAEGGSLLKKEISFRRKPKAPAAEAPQAEQPKAEGGSLLKKEISFKRKPKAAAIDAPKAEGGSLLKKEISFKRKPKAAAIEAPQAEQPNAEGGSFLKKQMSFKRKPKAAAIEAPQAEQPKAAGGSFLKRNISFRRKAKPAATDTPQAEQAKSEGVSFLKKDLSFKRKPKPKAKRGAKAPKPKKGLKTRKEARDQRPRGPVTHKKLVGLKIGASQLAAARVVNNGSAQLVQVARQSLEPGVVVGGELRDPDALADALKSFFAKNRLPKRGVRLGLANNRIGVRIFELEGIDDQRQLANAIRFRAQETLPIPIEEAVLDYQVVGERVDEEGRTLRRVMLVVAYRELIDRYVAACRKAGIQLVGIDLEAFALLRALSAQAGEQEDAPAAALVAVSIGHDRSTFAVSDGRICEFTRVLEWGGSTLDVAVARALDLAPSQAEPIKRALGLEGGEVPENVTEEQATAAREAIRREIQTFARELVSSLQFYQNQPGSLGIAEIIVTGGTAHLSGLAEQLQKLIGVRVRVGDPLEHVRTAKKLKGAEQIGSLAVAIGLGVER